MTIPPADMMLFARVVAEASFTGAARQMGITKQSASERVGRLEEALGVRLLERTTRSVRPTEAGARYYERCAAIAALVDEANQEARAAQIEPTGLLRVSAPVLYGRRFLAPVVAEYLRRYPKARVEILLADRRVNLVDEGFDLAIRIGEIEDSSMSVRKLGEGHTYYVASPAFLAANGAPTVETLRGTRAVGVRPVEQWEVDGTSLRVEPVLVVNDLEVACACAVAGVGVARLPAIVCRDAVADGRLRVLFELSAAMRRPVVALFPSHRNLPTRVRVFLDLLATLVEPMRPLALGPLSARR